ncbi:MAG: single-stranded DNA-binding protein [Crocinitomicaceae bacterium]
MNKLQNTVNLIGRSGIDPVIRIFENGVKLAKFSLATNETIIEVNGKTVKTQWHNLVAWGKKAELVEKFVKRGQLMAVEGKLINRGFTDASGNLKKVTEIQLTEVMLIHPKTKAQAKELSLENMKKIKQAEVKKLAEQNKAANKEHKKAS